MSELLHLGGKLFGPDNWRKSSRSSGGASNCVEVGFSGEVVGVRDTKDRAAGHFTATGEQWSRFVAAIRTGRYES